MVLEPDAVTDRPEKAFSATNAVPDGVACTGVRLPPAIKRPQPFAVAWTAALFARQRLGS